MTFAVLLSNYGIFREIPVSNSRLKDFFALILYYQKSEILLLLEKLNETVEGIRSWIDFITSQMYVNN